jgi:mannose-6-phosphate isomerase-like protein (cupin superfamily)
VNEAVDLSAFHMFVAGAGDAVTVQAGPSFWKEMMAPSTENEIVRRIKEEDGYLLIDMTLTGEFPHWEMHPNGDEIFLMREGSLDIDLDDGDDKWSQHLDAGQAFIVPKGAWHIARAEHAKVFVLTFGRGTEHRPK